MSPRLRIDNQIIADVPDTTGHHIALDGTTIFVDTGSIDVESRRRELVVQAPQLVGKALETRRTQDGTRVFQLDREGRGKQILPGGSVVSVELHQPIVVKPESGRGYIPNPYWRR